LDVAARVAVDAETMIVSLPQLLKNGAFDGRREIHPDRHAKRIRNCYGIILVR
jgi:hypothetical protein